MGSYQSSTQGAVCRDGTLLRDTSGAVKPRPSDHNTSTALIHLCHHSVLSVCSYSVKNKKSVELTWRNSREKAGENHRAAGWCQVHYSYFCGCWDQNVFKVRGKSFWKFDWKIVAKAGTDLQSATCICQRPAVKILKTLHINELWRGPPSPSAYQLLIRNFRNVPVIIAGI